MATASPTTANYTIDPASGSMTSTGANGMAPVLSDGSSSTAGQQSMGSLAPTAASDPYTIFNQNLTSMLTAAANANTQGQANIENQKSNLTALSVAPGGAQPFNPAVSSESQVGAQQALQAGFQPAIGSLTAQGNALGNAFSGISSAIQGIQAATQPMVLQPGQSLVSRDGKVIVGTDSYAPTGFTDGNGVPTFYNVRSGAVAGPAGGGSDPATSVSPVTSVSGSAMGGVDWDSYATSTSDLADVATKYSAFKTTSIIPSAQGIDATAGAMYGKTPVTGAMIMNAAATYGQDANMMAARIAQESMFGTSALAKSDNNVTGMAYVGQAGASQGSPRPPEEGGYYAKYKTIEQSINALGAWMQSNPAAPAQGASGSPPATVLSSLAANVAAGKTGFNDAMGALPNAAMSAALLAQVLKINPQFSITASNQNATAQGAALNQQATQVRPMVNHQQTAIEHLANLGMLLGRINYNDVPIVNGLRDWVSDKLSKDPNIATAQSEIGVVRGEVASVLAGGNSPTDADAAEAVDVVPNDVSPATFKQISDNVQKLMQNKIDQATDLSNIQQFGNGNVAGNSGTGTNSGSTAATMGSLAPSQSGSSASNYKGISLPN